MFNLCQQDDFYYLPYVLPVLTGLLLLCDLCLTCVDRITFIVYLSTSKRTLELHLLK